MFERYRAELCRTAYRVCRDPDAAEDLAQEALLRLMMEIGADRAPDNIRAWLHRVVANLAVSLLRREMVGRRLAGDLVRRDEPVSPEAIVLDSEQRSDLAAALRELPAGARTALLLAANGYSGAEIARTIGRTHGATRTLMSRARTTLRDRLDADATRPLAIPIGQGAAA
jgi:RNA polymerase sigma-70 factor (ECF subfamily)